MFRTLIIGYGNPSRNDDGAGLAVINTLRSLIGKPTLGINRDGFDELGQSLDTLFMHQLTPDLVDILVDYDQVFFIDAHTGIYPDPIHREQLTAQVDPSLVSHHLKPQSLLALVEQIHQTTPQGILISLRGYDFGFGETLTPQTSDCVQSIARELAQLNQ